MMLYGENEILVITFRVFTFFGSFIIMSNVVILLVINTNAELRIKMCLHSFSAVADLVDGISFFMAGHEQKYLLYTNQYYTRASPWDCMSKKTWPSLYVLGGQLTALTKFALATEYLIAIRYAMLYKATWGIRHKVVLGLIGCSVGIMNTGFAFLAAYKSPSSHSSMLCSITRSTGYSFSIFHFILITLAYILSAIIAFFIYKKMKKSKTTILKANRHLVTLITMILSILCIVMPMFVIIAREYGIIAVDDFVSDGFYCLYAITAITNLPLYVCLRRDFRAHLVHLLLREPT